MSDLERKVDDALRDAPGEHANATHLAAGARRRARARRNRRRTSLGAVAASAIVVAAIGGQWWTERGTGADPGRFNDDPPVLPDPFVTCGGEDSWPASAMAQEPGGETSEQDARIREALAGVLRDLPFEAPAELQERGADEARFVVLVDRADRMVVGVGEWDLWGPSSDGRILRFGVENEGHLSLQSSGGCQLQVAPPAGQEGVVVSAPEGGVEQEDRTITVLATERECSGGRDVTPYLSEPEVVETEDRVSVRLTADEVVGAASCQGNPSVEVEVELTEPLGDREIVDGGSWPPTPLAE